MYESINNDYINYTRYFHEPYLTYINYYIDILFNIRLSSRWNCIYCTYINLLTSIYLIFITLNNVLTFSLTKLHCTLTLVLSQIYY